MAILALLSISQAAKAAEVTVYFQKPDEWSTSVQAYVYDDLGNHPKEWQDADACSRFYTSTGVELWSYTFSDQFTNVIFKDGTNQYPANNGTKMKVVNNCVYNTKSTTGTSLSEFVKNSAFTYTLTGGYEGGGWSDESANFEFVGDGKYTYTFTAAQTGEFRFRVKTSYKTKEELCPDVDPTTKRKELTSTPEDVKYANPNDNSAASIKDNYWFYSVTAGKKYTFTLSEQYLQATDGGYYHSRKLSVVPEEAVVTKVIKLFNGFSELTGSNGKYTLDLSSATTDATITLSIDGASYGLATAQTISAAGTTSGIAFTTEGTKALTLKAGLIYYLSVTDDGKMTVVAKDNPYVVAGAGFYLVGDFMSPYNHSDVNPGGDIPGKINYERLYFKFEQQTDGSYKIDIPACLTAKMQILGVSVDGVPRVYGPKGIEKLHGAKDYGKAIPATDGSVGGDSETNNLVVVEGFDDKNNYWDLFTRNDGVTDDDGAYEVSFKYNPDTESPTTWTIKHNSCKRVMYLLSNAKGSTAQPLYDSRESVSQGYSDNASASAIHLEGITNTYFVLGTVVRNIVDAGVANQAGKANDGIHEIPSDKGGRQCGTHDKFFFLGADPVYDSDNTIVTKDSYLLTANKPAVAISKLKGNKIVQVNPTKGRDDESRKDNSYGMQAEIYVPNAGNIDYPDVISMVGPAIPSTTTTNVDGTTKWLWDATAGDMTYDESDHCYKLVLNTSADLYGKTFRFVGDHAITQNWYEDGTPANVKYPIEKVEGTSEATVADPNVVNYTSDCTENTIVHDSDIKWNRGAGLWTVRFYIIPGKDNKKTFQYTITGASKIYIPVTAHMGKLLRTYTSAVDVVPVDANVLIYAAQSYQKNTDKTPVAGDETGTVKLYRLKFIPANQGVVLYSPNSPLGNGTPTKLEVVPAYSATVNRYSSNAFDYVEGWAKPETKKEQIWVNQVKHENDGEKWNNYLMPVLTDTKVTQFSYDENNKWSGRIFAFNRYSLTDAGKANGVESDDITNEDPSKRDYYSFFRAAGTVKASYSYLVLPKDIMTGNGQILDENHDTANKEDINNFAKSMAWFEDIDAPMDNETTGISELKNNTSNADAAYYTLQGVKVVKPVKGIYIHQGKKVIVK